MICKIYFWYTFLNMGKLNDGYMGATVTKGAKISLIPYSVAYHFRQSLQ